MTDRKQKAIKELRQIRRDMDRAGMDVPWETGKWAEYTYARIAPLIRAIPLIGRKQEVIGIIENRLGCNAMCKEPRPCSHRTLATQLYDRLPPYIRGEFPEEPMQPLYKDEHGTIRFRKNAIVRFLLDAGPYDLNKIGLMDFSQQEREQFQQLIGTSLCGYEEIEFVSDKSVEKANRLWEEQGESYVERREGYKPILWDISKPKGTCPKCGLPNGGPMVKCPHCGKYDTIERRSGGERRMSSREWTWLMKRHHSWGVSPSAIDKKIYLTDGDWCVDRRTKDRRK